MSKWDKLNKSLDDVLNRMTQKDWENWDSQRVAKKEEKRILLLNKSIEQQKILFSCSIVFAEYVTHEGYNFDDHYQKQIAEKIKNDPGKLQDHFFLRKIAA